MKIGEFQAALELWNQRSGMSERVKQLLKASTMSYVTWQEGGPAYTISVPIKRDELMAAVSVIEEKIRAIDKQLEILGVEMVPRSIN
jgi:hypothetical protein